MIYFSLKSYIAVFLYIVVWGILKFNIGWEYFNIQEEINGKSQFFYIRYRNILFFGF
jgi:hypothetical protein